MNFIMTVTIVLGVITLINIVIFIIYLKDRKKYNLLNSQLQIIENCIVYNEKGITKGEMSVGDVIIGKIKDKFIIADVEDLPPLLNLNKYLSNSKIG